MYCPLAAASGEFGSLTFDGGYCRANSAKTTGSTVTSQKLMVICSGEYDSISVLFWIASARALARDPTEWTVSASAKSNHWPRASRAPVATALFFPVQPSGRGPASMTRTLGKD